MKHGGWDDDVDAHQRRFPVSHRDVSVLYPSGGKRVRQEVSSSSILTGRVYPLPASGETGDRDLIVIRDLVLRFRIGVYEQERLRPQRIRLNLVLEVDGSEADDDIAKVLSYDEIISGVKALAEGEHINLVETLAERVAELCFAHPNVAAVHVGVEKLDIHAQTESVGVEIRRRRRESADPSVYPLPGFFARAARPRPKHPITILCLDDETLEGAYRDAWLERAAEQPGRVVLAVDAGRYGTPLDRDSALDVATAHHLRLIAMEQSARALAATNPLFVPCDSESALTHALEEERIPVWLPVAMTLGRPEIAERPDTTAATLALWLARHYGAERLIVVSDRPDPLPSEEAIDSRFAPPEDRFETEVLSATAAEQATLTDR